MKLFRRPSRGGAGERPRRRRSHLLLGALGAGVVGFLLGCFLFFPTTALRDRLTSEVAARSDLRLQIAGLSLHFPLGLNARGLVLSGGELPGPLKVDTLRITPAWLACLGGNPGADLSANLLGGELNAQYLRDGAFSASGRDLKLHLPLGNNLTLAVSGTLRQATAAGVLPLRPGTDSQLNLEIADLRLTGLKAVGAARDTLRLGTATVAASGQGNSFRIEKLKCSGGELALDGGGSLLLATPPPQSRLNLTFNLTPAAGLDPSLKDLLGMFAKPTRDGSLRLRLTGSLAAPNLQ